MLCCSYSVIPLRSFSHRRIYGIHVRNSTAQILCFIINGFGPVRPTASVIIEPSLFLALSSFKSLLECRMVARFDSSVCKGPSHPVRERMAAFAGKKFCLFFATTLIRLVAPFQDVWQLVLRPVPGMSLGCALRNVLDCTPKKEFPKLRITTGSFRLGRSEHAGWEAEAMNSSVHAAISRCTSLSGISERSTIISESSRPILRHMSTPPSDEEHKDAILCPTDRTTP